MRNYEVDIDELYQRIETLELDNAHLRSQRNGTNKKKRKGKKKPVVKDEDGTIISVGDWVRVTTPGKFMHNEGEVEGWKKWVTFVDITGVKQVRAPHNLLISNDEQKQPAGSNPCSSKYK